MLPRLIRGHKAMAEGRTQTHEDVLARTAKWT